MRIPRYRLSQLWLRSTTQRFGFFRLEWWLRNFLLLNLRRAMWGINPNTDRTTWIQSASYALSRHICCGFLCVGLGLWIGILRIVRTKIVESCQLAGAMTIPIGTPLESVRMLRFTPCFNRSVGFLPVFLSRELAPCKMSYPVRAISIRYLWRCHIPSGSFSRNLWIFRWPSILETSGGL